MSLNRKTKAIAALFAIASVVAVAFTNCADQGFQVSSSDGGDPLLDLAWHLNNTGQKVFASSSGTAGMDLNLQKTWAAGVYGKGVKIQISDTGFEDTHEDLQDNFLYDGTSKDYTLYYPYTSNTAPPKSSSDVHGTSVAGLAAAVGWNGRGSRGVAPKASIVSSNVISASVSPTYSMLGDSASSDFDISNMSWGSTQNYVSRNSDNTDYETILFQQVVLGRNGKGKIFVKAAGNDYQVDCYQASGTTCIGNSNFDQDNVNPYQIVVAALTANGWSASYSSGGSNLWISSFGGMYGYDSPAMITTDRMGCSYGEATSSSTSTLSFDKGGSGNTGCNYTASFNGTSSASPTLTGVVALMLEANPDLTWRDVKYILAKTARQTNSPAAITSHPLNKTLPTGLVWEQAYVTNAAGFKFHNWYGFGTVDADSAVTLAKSYTSTLGTYSDTTWYSSGTLNTTIPNYSAAGVTSTISVTNNMKIEAVRIKLAVSHPAISELQIELTSPSGTKSIIINGQNALTNQSTYDGNEIFLSNAFFQESSYGTWTLKVIDTSTNSGTGTLTNWSINIAGGS
ncbi:MAG TPA: S8 family serine peptidase [Bdellovibrio sp.]|uniref:S8 family serine peptidase n=1 Tax=Bdellovibrio sp. TaxID=28201 RepID=UPI002EE5B539